MPKPSPEPAEAERRRLDLAGVLEAAAAHYQRRLALPEGAPRADYLLRPGPDGGNDRPLRPRLGRRNRGALTADTGAAKASTPAQLVEAGLLRAKMRKPAAPSKLFFNRVMFPIRDRRGTVDQLRRPHSGRRPAEIRQRPGNVAVLQAPHAVRPRLARAAVRHGAELVVVEGYMDVIAAAQAGFGGAVAPLGTALTAEQLERTVAHVPRPCAVLRRRRRRRRAAARARRNWRCPC